MTAPLSSVSTGFTSTTAAPAPSATNGRDAAGCTMPEVPTTRHRSQSSSAANARSQGSAGSISPNHTIPGRISPSPHTVQAGGASRSIASRSASEPAVASSAGAPGSTSAGAPQSAQRCSNREPCRCARTRAPARSCRSSTFWVTTSGPGARCCQAATASCPGFGRRARTIRARHRYQDHTSAGSARNASSVASSSAENRSHRPVWASRNVGMPDSALIPAPESTTGRSAAATSARTASSASGSRSGAEAARTGCGSAMSSA